MTCAKLRGMDLSGLNANDLIAEYVRDAAARDIGVDYYLAQEVKARYGMQHFVDHHLAYVREHRPAVYMGRVMTYAPFRMSEQDRKDALDVMAAL